MILRLFLKPLTVWEKYQIDVFAEGIQHEEDHRRHGSSAGNF
jgi:hypothetical protein